MTTSLSAIALGFEQGIDLSFEKAVEKLIGLLIAKSFQLHPFMKQSLLEK
jgi:hypothetical protein